MRSSKNVTDIRNLSMTVQQLVEGRSNATSFSQPESDEDGIIFIGQSDPGWIIDADPDIPDYFRINDPTCAKGATVIITPADAATSLLGNGLWIPIVEDGYFQIARLRENLSFAAGEIIAIDESTVWTSGNDNVLHGDSEVLAINMTTDIATGRIITGVMGTHTFNITVSMWDIGAGNNAELAAGIRHLDTDGTTELGQFDIALGSSMGSAGTSFDSGNVSVSGFLSMLPGESIQGFSLATFAGTADYDLIMGLVTTVPRPFDVAKNDLKLRYAIVGP